MNMFVSFKTTQTHAQRRRNCKRTLTCIVIWTMEDAPTITCLTHGHHLIQHRFTFKQVRVSGIIVSINIGIYLYFRLCNTSFCRLYVTCALSGSHLLLIMLLIRVLHRAPSINKQPGIRDHLTVYGFICVFPP